MDEREPTQDESLVELVELMLQGTASDEQKRELQVRLLASAEDRKAYLHRLNLHSALRRQFALDAEAETSEPLSLTREGRPDGGRRGSRARPSQWRWAAAAAVAAGVLFAAVYFQRPGAERPIAEVTGLSGSLQWTGDGGRVSYDLSVGTRLRGGTIEGLEPGSWLELEFRDGSTVTVSGNSMLTFSDRGQKELHLKEGNMSANVNPQPASRPMLIYTRSARLEVLGTQFDVNAGLLATTLNVSQGTVRVRRLIDGSTVDVLARHRVVAAADRELSPVPVPDPVDRWTSQLHLGPAATQGKWSPRIDTEDAKLGAIPYTSPEGKTIYTVGFVPSHGDKPPVVIHLGSRLRVRGRIASPCKVYFGVTVRQPNGEFAGRFQAVRPAADFRGGEDFEVILPIQEFRLDPSLARMKSRLADSPFDLDVEAFWCHTLDRPAGLELTEVELIPPAGSVSD